MLRNLQQRSRAIFSGIMMATVATLSSASASAPTIEYPVRASLSAPENKIDPSKISWIHIDHKDAHRIKAPSLTA